MTMQPDNHEGDDTPQGVPAFDRDRIARELAVLGEPPPDGGELEWAGAVGEGDDDVDVDVATVGALFRVAGASGVGAEGLSALDQRRVWKTLADRLGGPDAPRSGGGRGHGMQRALLTALAMAAGVVLVTRLGAVGQVPSSTHGDERSRAATEALGAQARASLEVLGGDVDGARARALADAHATRLRADREGT